MDQGEIIESYGKYVEFIKALAENPLLKSVTVAELFQEEKSTMQRLYKQLRAEKFDGYLTDFLCYISAGYLVSWLKRSLPDNASMVDWLVAFIDSYRGSRTDVRNVLRLYREYPKFYSLLKAEITDIEYDDYGELSKFEWGNVREVKERILAKMALAGFMDLVIYEDQEGKMPTNYDELVEIIKVMVRNGQEDLKITE